MRILHTEWSDGWGGQEKRILSEMLGMRNRGHQIRLATRPSCLLGQEASKVGIPVDHVPFGGKFHLPSIMQIKDIVRREGIDIINTHSGIDSWVGGIAARLAGGTLVRTRHLNLPLHRNWINFVHYLPHRVVTCGNAMRSKLIVEHGFPPEMVVSIPTGIDFSSFHPSRAGSDMRAELGLPADAWVVLMVAVIRRVKRHEIAIRGFAEFLLDNPKAVLLLCGDGPLREATEQLCRELGIERSVLFLGHRDDVPNVMAAADVLLLTSESEGIPQAISQGLGLGLPVVATAVGGVPELVQDGETGLLVPPEQPSAVTAALCKLAGDPELASCLGRRGRDLALRQLSLEAMLDATERLYDVLSTQVGHRSDGNV